VNHPELQAQVDALLDGELAQVEAAELEAHLAGCAECGRYHDERLALRSALKQALPSARAPDPLRVRARQAWQPPRPARPRSGPALARWLGMAATLVIVALGSWQLALRRAAADTLAEEVLRSHVRALMPGHLTDVRSTDQHTVKPWFDGVLDYSPPVHDFAASGYPLVGGRLDYVGGRPVAALVYGRRLHVISVLVWPAAGADRTAGGPRLQQGYHLLHWRTPAYTWWVVSDLGTGELEEFARLLQQADTAAQTDSGE
jgi:anti-sigma factor RsiW